MNTPDEPQSEYAADVAEGKRLVELFHSLHNGELRQEKGETWYYSELGTQFSRDLVHEMSVLLPRVLEAYDIANKGRVKLAYQLVARDLDATNAEAATADWRTRALVAEAALAAGKSAIEQHIAEYEARIKRKEANLNEEYDPDLAYDISINDTFCDGLDRALRHILAAEKQAASADTEPTGGERE